MLSEPISIDFPLWPENIDKMGKITSIVGVPREFRIIDGVAVAQTISEKESRKLVFLQRLEFQDTSEIIYRFTSYMLGVKPGGRGRWIFGQYSLLIPPADLSRLLEKARAKGWEGV